MEGVRSVVRSADGTPVGLLTAGAGPALLLVHGGLSGLSRWAPLWPLLLPHFRVTALDRRGRGSSGDGSAYALEREFEDVRAVAEHLADEAGDPVDVFGHSIGGVVVLGAAGLGAPLRRIALYEPPGPPTVTADWLDRLRSLVAAGRPGPAIASFLIDVMGMTPAQVTALRDAPPGPDDVLAVATRTLVREGEALAALDPAALASPVHQPTLLLHGTAGPPWAETVVRTLSAHLSDARVVAVPGAGHEGVDTHAAAVTAQLVDFFGTG